VDYELVIFDCDGVLVDSERLTVAVEARLLTELGWSRTPEDVVDSFLGRSSAEMLAEVEKRLGAEATRVFDERSTAEVHAAFETDLIAVPGVEDVVQWLGHHHTASCVASSGSHEKMRKTLALTGLYGHFEGRIFSAQDVGLGKPAPDLFLYAAAQMGIDPKRCAVIEDSVYGVQAAVRAGMTAFGFAGGLTDAAALDDAGAVVFNEMVKLPGLLCTEAVQGERPL
jgi:HAD superfamily hydrolase (TIGR01509 family)